MKRNAIFILAACFPLAACDNNYIERKDTLTFGAGDAVATNNAAQIADPWPRRSQNTRIPMDGAKAANALEHYRDSGSNGNGDNGNGGSGGSTPPSPPPTPH